MSGEPEFQIETTNFAVPQLGAQGSPADSGAPAPAGPPSSPWGPPQRDPSKFEYVHLNEDGTYVESARVADPGGGRPLAGSSGWTPPKLASDAMWNEAGVPRSVIKRDAEGRSRDRHDVASGRLVAVIGGVAVGGGEGDMYVYEHGVTVTVEGRRLRNLPIFFGPVGALFGLVASFFNIVVQRAETAPVPPPMELRVATASRYTGNGLVGSHHNAVWLPFSYLRNIEISGIVGWGLRLTGPSGKGITVRSTPRTHPGFSRSTGLIIDRILMRTRESSSHARVYEMVATRAALLGLPRVVLAGVFAAAAYAVGSRMVRLPETWNFAGSSTSLYAAGVSGVFALGCVVSAVRFAGNLLPTRLRIRAQ